jgi:alkaline phosphatase D
LSKKLQIMVLCNVLIGMLQGQIITHGPIVGGVTNQNAVFVLRTNESTHVQVELSTSPNFINSILSTTFVTGEDADNFAKVKTDGLQANIKYYYRALINSEPVIENFERSFRTFTEPGAESIFSFQFGSGQQHGSDPNSNVGNIFPIMAIEQPAFMIHQGDWGYPDTTDSESGSPGLYFSLDYLNVAESYRARYDNSFPMIDLLRIAPVAYIYDDHDMIDDNSDSTFPQQGIQNSIRGYMNMFPGYPLADSTKGIWHNFAYGNVEVFMVDNRSQRSPNIAAFNLSNPDSFVFDPPPGHSILGIDQMNWLLQELENSTAFWKFISTGTPFNPALYLAIELAILTQGRIDSVRIPGGGYITPAEVALELADKWVGFPEDIAKIIKYIRVNNIENVIILSGDTHTAGIDDGKNSIFPELMDSGLDRTNGQQLPLFEIFGVKIWNRGGHTSNLAPSEFGNSYGRVTVFKDDSVRLEAISENGNILGKHTVQAGFLPREIGSALAPLDVTLNFGEVATGETGILGFMMVSTSTGDLQVSDIYIEGDSEIFIDHLTGDTPFILKPGTKRIIDVGYSPLSAGKTSEATITVTTNDPENPTYTLTALGTAMSANVIQEADNMVDKYELYQNYPNPFNPITFIKFDLPISDTVTLEIYNIVGQKIGTILDKKIQSGSHTIIFNDENLSSGIYFYKIKSGNFLKVRKMILVK